MAVNTTTQIGNLVEVEYKTSAMETATLEQD